MKIKFIGGQRRDGSYPKLLVGDVEIAGNADGVYDVPNEDVDWIIRTGNFVKAGKVATVEEVIPAVEDIPAVENVVPLSPAEKRKATMAAKKK